MKRIFPPHSVAIQLKILIPVGTAMIMVANAEQIHHLGWMWAAGVVLANIVFVLLLALAINNLIHVGRYPVLHRHPAPTDNGFYPAELVLEDVEWALRKMGGVTDVDEEELLEIFKLASEHAREK